MKLARYKTNNNIGCGVIQDQSVFDFGAMGLGFENISDVIKGGDEALEEIRVALAKSQPTYDLNNVELLCPVTGAGKYLAIGMNYAKHQEESKALGVAIPEHQVWFNKQTTCLAGPFDEIDPGVTQKLDYESELGLIIGKTTKNVKACDAYAHIFGYFVANDVSARDWQFHTATFTMGKSFDTHGPIGPWIVTADEVPDPQNLDIRCFVNDELRQSNNTANMVHKIKDQIEYLSTAFTLEPGDLIATGTPEGVGVAMTPPTFLVAGDIVRCEVEGLGSINNRVKL
jgi:2-keto-4-pentenoate hydratase/2-oxohepta-3-ene-1,7-dioic acid hydratase in catechol pathway|tara:strand:- start:4721 stop:5575 length:855 start_codon:yes stop_codon:yes gene_type:complete